MTLAKPQSGNAPRAHIPPFEFEPFSCVAHAELRAMPFVPVGVCMNPSCSRPFNPRREWQLYCCAACRKAGEREMVRIGAQAAPALLAWQMGRYAKPGPLADLSRAGRRYYSGLAAEWLRDRRARIEVSG